MGNGEESERLEDIRQPRPSAKPSLDELKRRFFYHPPRDDAAVAAHKKVSDLTYQLAVNLVDLCPAGRNLSLALTELESVRMRANAAIAVDDPRP